MPPTATVLVEDANVTCNGTAQPRFSSPDAIAVSDARLCRPDLGGTDMLYPVPVQCSNAMSSNATEFCWQEEAACSSDADPSCNSTNLGRFSAVDATSSELCQFDDVLAIMTLSTTERTLLAINASDQERKDSFETLVKSWRLPQK
jgi:hypothetical protein